MSLLPIRKHLGRLLFPAVLFLGMAALAGCGGAVSQGAVSHDGASSAPNYGAAATPGNGSSGSSTSGPQYLIKSLSVSLAVKDTRKVATELQAWVASTDTRSSTAGMNYQQTSDGGYRVMLTFSVQAAVYPQVQQYLASYTQQHEGTLLSLNETVQDVTNSYVDAQSQLANLRVEQARLQALLAKASSLSDVLAIEQRLTDVEGKIEQIEAHLNALNGQTQFYRVTVTLEPVAQVGGTAVEQWNPLGTLVDALRAARVFGEGLVNLLIWLAVFSVFLLPFVPVYVVVRRRVRARRERMAQEMRSRPPIPVGVSKWDPAPAAAPVAAPPAAPTSPPADGGGAGQ